MLRYYNVKHVILHKNDRNVIYLKLCFCVLRVDRPIVDQVRSWSGEGSSSERNSSCEAANANGCSALLRRTPPHHAVEYAIVRLLLHCCVELRTLHVGGKQPAAYSHCRQASSVDVAR